MVQSINMPQDPPQCQVLGMPPTLFNHHIQNHAIAIFVSKNQYSNLDTTHGPSPPNSIKHDVIVNSHKAGKNESKTSYYEWKLSQKWRCDEQLWRRLLKDMRSCRPGLKHLRMSSMKVQCRF
jgi:hypothetical protein